MFDPLTISWPTLAQFRRLQDGDLTVFEELCSFPIRDAEDAIAVLRLVKSRQLSDLEEAAEQDLAVYPLGFQPCSARLTDRVAEYGFDIDEYERKTDENRKALRDAIGRGRLTVGGTDELGGFR